MPVALESPYPGLAAFGPQDVGLFFGREQLTATVVTRLTEQLTSPGLLMALGPSGSGKSSLLRAGLLPADRDRRAARARVTGVAHGPYDPWGASALLELATRIAAIAVASLPGH